jgi:excisionase family DNA binding protein
MNLADAIRLAAQTSPNPLVGDPRPQIEVIDNPAFQTPDKEKESAMEQAPDQSRVPHPPSSVVANGGVVRLELFLSPDQLNGLFRAVVANQHSVMTLREAAQYLRIAASYLSQMAKDGKIPALTIDGKYRFARTALDEWLNLQGRQREMEA